MSYLYRCLPADTLDDAVRDLTPAIAAGAPRAVLGMKASLNEIANVYDKPATLHVREARCAADEDLTQGLRALTERRTPRFARC